MVAVKRAASPPFAHETREEWAPASCLCGGDQQQAQLQVVRLRAGDKSPAYRSKDFFSKLEIRALLKQIYAKYEMLKLVRTAGLFS